MNQTVLVTGANGFVGQALCPALRLAGYEVRGAVRKLPLEAGSILLMEVGDIGPDTNWIKALKGVNHVIHLAGRVHVLNENLPDALNVFRQVNTMGTETLARAAAKQGVQRFIYISSIGVHGQYTTGQPFSEADVPHPHNDYALSKWEAEQALWKVSEETGLPVTVLRPPLIYGPGVRANFLLLMQLVRRGIPLPLASIRNRRNLVFLYNFVDAILLALSHPEAAGETFLVADTDATSVPQLMRLLAKLMKCPSRLFPFPEKWLMQGARLLGRSAVTDRLCRSLEVDSRKIRKMLGWQTPRTLEEGLAETVTWFMQYEDVMRKRL